jgi:hypothetical protein
VPLAGALIPDVFLVWSTWVVATGVSLLLAWARWAMRSSGSGLPASLGSQVWSALAAFRKSAEALRHVEDVVVKAGGAALRYGPLYGPGATDDLVRLVRKRFFPLIGGGTGHFSWVHLDDAASATVLAVEQKAKGVFNIVDDDQPRSGSGCLTWPSARGRSGRGGSPSGWSGCWPGNWRWRC